MLTANTIERVALQTIAFEVERCVADVAPAPFFSDLSAPAHLAKLGRRLFEQDPECHQYVFLLDADQRLFAFMAVEQESIQLITRDVFRFALLDNAASVAFCTLRVGDVVPRGGDYALQQHLRVAADLLGVRLFDHLVIDSSEYYSFRELGHL